MLAHKRMLAEKTLLQDSACIHAIACHTLCMLHTLFSCRPAQLQSVLADQPTYLAIYSYESGSLGKTGAGRTGADWDSTAFARLTVSLRLPAEELLTQL